MRIKLALCVAVVTVAGCATTPSADTQAVATVGSGMVQGCQLLGAVNGSSLMDGVLQAKGVESAKDSAKAQAAKWGATAVVWTHVTQRYWGAELVTADAYRCSHPAP